MAQIRFFLAEAWEYMIRGRGTTLASIVALSAVLFLLALVLLATHNVELLAERLESRKGLTVFLAEGTVKNYVSEILEKLDTRDRTRAVLKAITLRLL